MARGKAIGRHCEPGPASDACPAPEVDASPLTSVATRCPLRQPCQREAGPSTPVALRHPKDDLTMTPSGPAVSRRALLALLGAVGVGGCARNSSNAERADDRFIAAIRADPMFMWAPPGNSIRDVEYSPMMTTQPMPSRTSDVVVTYFISDSAALPEMFQRAKDEKASR